MILIELMITMLISTILLLSMMSLLPVMESSLLPMYRDYRLESLLLQNVQTIEKDLRRTGFIIPHKNHHHDEINPAIEVQPHCVLIRYDENLNGNIEQNDKQYAEHFAYRFNQQALEYKRGAINCSGKGWRKLTDPAEVTIIHFHIKQQNSLFVLFVQAKLTQFPSVVKKVSHIVRYENISLSTRL